MSAAAPELVEHRPKHALEAYIARRGLAMARVYPGFYLENFIDVWPPIRRLRSRRLAFWLLPIPERTRTTGPMMPHVSIRDDFGGVVAGVFQQIDDLVGDDEGLLVVSEALSLRAVLDAISSALGEPIDLDPIALELYRALPLPPGLRGELEVYARLDEFTAPEGEARTRAALARCRQLYPGIQSCRAWATRHAAELAGWSRAKLTMTLLAGFVDLRAWSGRALGALTRSY
jgi:hypothetical protein